MPGADVTLTDLATNSKQTTTTNDSGRYNFPVIHPGLYDITVSKSGFKVAKLAQQKVSIGLMAIPALRAQRWNPDRSGARLLTGPGGRPAQNS